MCSLSVLLPSENGELLFNIGVSSRATFHIPLSDELEYLANPFLPTSVAAAVGQYALPLSKLGTPI